jgi:hypothetical protein
LLAFSGNPMSSLPRLFVGSLIALCAVDYGFMSGAGLNFLRAGAVSLAAPAEMTGVNRRSKGDRLAIVSSPRDEADTVIATVEVVGLRDAAVVYRSRDGRVLFRTDPLTNATVLVKDVTLPEITIRDTRRTNVETVPAAKEAPPSAPAQAASRERKTHDPKVLEGCDAAFSPLASARANFSTRCLAASAPATKIASALP